MDRTEVGKAPGEIVAIEDKSVQVAAKGGVLRIGKLRPEKGEKLGPREFARSTGIKAGDRFE